MVEEQPGIDEGDAAQFFERPRSAKVGLLDLRRFARRDSGSNSNIPQQAGSLLFGCLWAVSRPPCGVGGVEIHQVLGDESCLFRRERNVHHQSSPDAVAYTASMGFIAAGFDARAAHWWLPVRWLYLFVKWCLVILGAYLLVRLFYERWGWAGVFTFLVAPALTGLAQWAQGGDS